MLVLADIIKPINFIPNDGFLDTVFHQSWLAISILGQPQPAYKVTLIGLIIFAIIASAVNFVTERLTEKKVGSLTAAIVVTVIGSLLFQTYVRLPNNIDFQVEGVYIISALLGAIIVGVFYVLIKGKVGKKGK